MSLFQKIRASIISKYYRLWILKGKKVLDVGCGNAVVSELLKKNLDISLYGTDIIDYRKKKIPFRSMEHPAKLPFDAASFDYVIFNDSLHHTRYIEELLLEAVRVAPIILIFEDCENVFLKIIDKVLNYLYCSEMSSAVNFKNENEWCLLFNKLGFGYEIGTLSYPFWYPIRHMCFKLKKN